MKNFSKTLTVQPHLKHGELNWSKNGLNELTSETFIESLIDYSLKR